MYRSHNVQDHGLEDITEEIPAQNLISGNGYIRGIKQGPMGSLVRDPSIPLNIGPGLAITYQPPRVKLVPIPDGRRSAMLQPPTAHLGRRLTQNASPIIAQICCEYLTSLGGEANDLAPDQRVK